MSEDQHLKEDHILYNVLDNILPVLWHDLCLPKTIQKKVSGEVSYWISVMD